MNSIDKINAENVPDFDDESQYSECIECVIACCILLSRTAVKRYFDKTKLPDDRYFTYRDEHEFTKYTWMRCFELKEELHADWNKVTKWLKNEQLQRSLYKSKWAGKLWTRVAHPKLIAYEVMTT